ncbi:16S rRNA (cytidine(1402)-2'-O)-methyltransferase [Corynebacterium yudongzhengii]|uniref:Ribosomal RNA small subunit methyltransferase I n=1 Tax=Corynebacterium yudongzhengii TaxID=2080740 RepID=A0A2U1T821_9CORY|nr:16S rRNA (cytidine(1402)-2'-O)-methyltransferase [Corynebacterium yudongzhengii]AWB83011.1 16S rRNA (cytidine(1402)-2'-O)-methyltransferase [Corynebacterium yudongzhengii]PWC02115.1 16S rRNA (cytidine(1402)-2'-O)-methyltransferase [Corynebacterium yudongzhengii]
MTHASSHLPRGVIVAATPLGNIEDASPRLKQALSQAEVIAAEDTRRTRALAAALGVEITGRVVSNFDHNEEARVAKLLDDARAGSVVIVTDAGMPLVSDPGLALVDAAHDAGIPVTCLPGPSAVPTALALSGLNVGQFIFDGFAPRKAGAKRSWLESLVGQPRAVCFFESPHRIADTLTVAAEVLGARRAAVCRELTKTFEEVVRGDLAELAQWAAEGAKGEITVVIEGAREQETTLDIADLVENVEAQVAAGVRLRDACKQAAAGTGVKKRELYDAVIHARDDKR